MDIVSLVVSPLVISVIVSAFFIGLMVIQKKEEIDQNVFMD